VAELIMAAADAAIDGDDLLIAARRHQYGAACHRPAPNNGATIRRGTTMPLDKRASHLRMVSDLFAARPVGRRQW